MFYFILRNIIFVRATCAFLKVKKKLFALQILFLQKQKQNYNI